MVGFFMRGRIGGMKQQPFTFRASILLASMFAGAAFWSAYMLFIDPSIPNRAFRKMPLVGAQLGLFAYTIPFLATNLRNLRYTTRGLLVGMAVVAIELGLLSCTFRK
jgi:hypothetical protein